MKKEEEVLKRLNKEVHPYPLSVLMSYAKEIAVQFKMDTSPLTPQIIDGEKKVREQTERLYDNWKLKHKEG